MKSRRCAAGLSIQKTEGGFALSGERTRDFLKRDYETIQNDLKMQNLSDRSFTLPVPDRKTAGMSVPSIIHKPRQKRTFLFVTL